MLGYIDYSQTNEWIIFRSKREVFDSEIRVLEANALCDILNVFSMVYHQIARGKKEMTQFEIVDRGNVSPFSLSLSLSLSRSLTLPSAARAFPFFSVASPFFTASHFFRPRVPFFFGRVPFFGPPPFFHTQPINSVLHYLPHTHIKKH